MEDCPERMSEGTFIFQNLQQAIQDWLFPDFKRPEGASEGDVEEAAHVRTVAGLMAVLAPGRGLEPSLAELIGWLHDAGRLMPDGFLADHAALGAAAADGFLTARANLNPRDRLRVTEAIRHHSSKKNLDGGYDELLKDADAYQRFIEGAPVLEKASWARRIRRVHQELAALLGNETTPGSVLTLEPSSMLTEYVRFILNVAFWAGSRRAMPLNEAAIHDNRVFLRQSKALLGVFKPLLRSKAYRQLQHGLSEIIHAFEPVRTLEVEQQALQAFRDVVIKRTGIKASPEITLDGPVEAEDLHHDLLDWTEAQLNNIGKSLEVARGALNRKDWTSSLAEWTRQAGKAAFCSKAASKSLENAAQKRLLKAMNRWALRYGTLQVEDPNEVHRSRLEAKKIRYLLRAAQELPFSELEFTKGLLHALSVYQEISGRLHDVSLSRNSAKVWSLGADEGILWKDQGAPANLEKERFDNSLSMYLNFRDDQAERLCSQLKEAHTTVLAAMAKWKLRASGWPQDQE